MMFIAEELREIMAKLGVRTVDELVGRTDLLKIKTDINSNAAMLDLAPILGLDGNKKTKVKTQHFNAKKVYDFKLSETMDEAVLLPSFLPHFEKNESASIDVEVSSINRTLGTITGSEITKRFGDSLSEDTYTVNCHGGGGQSFGAFIPKGMTMRLTGDSNDYFGKGLSGGKLVVKPEENVSFKAEENIIIGNVALYGATSGKAFINGIAGERFCVRNSGAIAVVEGCGDHGCEYMTGGRAVVLGATGKNFAAGMSGGIAYVLDMNHDFYLRVNKQMVEMSEVTEKDDIRELKKLINEHVKETGSKLGTVILEDFDKYLPFFKKIIPTEYKKIIESLK